MSNCSWPLSRARTSERTGYFGVSANSIGVFSILCSFKLFILFYFLAEPSSTSQYKTYSQGPHSHILITGGGGGGGGGVWVIYLGLKFWLKVIFLGLWKMYVCMYVCMYLCMYVCIFWGIKYEPLSDPPPLSSKFVSGAPGHFILI